MAWLIGWNRRKSKLVKGSTAGAQTDYQMKLTVYKSSGMDTIDTIYLGGYVNNDFRDLRFTSSDETTLLPYWIESYTSGVSAIVWVKIDYIPADPFSKFIYIYYNYPSATAASSGTNTFILFSDFSSGTLTPEWIVNHVTGGSNGISSSTYYSSPYASYLSTPLTNNGNSWNPKPTTSEMIYKNITLPNTGLLFEYMGSKPVATNWDGGFQSFIYADGVYTNTGAWCTSIGSPNTCGWTFRSVNISAYKNKPVSIGFYAVTFSGASDQMHTQYQDDVRIRQYASPEPIWDQSSPEQIYTACTAPVCNFQVT